MFSRAVVAPCRPPFIAPKAIMPHQSAAVGHSRPMVSWLEKLDFWAIPKLGQRPDHFTNTPLRLIFLSKAMPLSSKPISALMYR